MERGVGWDDTAEVVVEEWEDVVCDSGVGR